MSIVTISRETGAGGSYVALKLAEKLGCSCFEQQIINDVAQKMGKHSTELSDFDQETYNRVGVFFQDALASITQGGTVFHPFGIGPLDWDSAELFSTFPQKSFQEKDYFEVLSQVVKEFASHCNAAVFLGRGAVHILTDEKNAFHFRIVADIEDRINRIAEEQKLDYDKAKYIVEKRDVAAANFVCDFFDKDWNDPHSYNLVLNTSKLGLDRCVDLIYCIVNQGES